MAVNNNNCPNIIETMSSMLNWNESVEHSSTLIGGPLKYTLLHGLISMK